MRCTLALIWGLYSQPQIIAYYSRIDMQFMVLIPNICKKKKITNMNFKRSDSIKLTEMVNAYYKFKRSMAPNFPWVTCQWKPAIHYIPVDGYKRLTSNKTLMSGSRASHENALIWFHLTTLAIMDSLAGASCWNYFFFVFFSRTPWPVQTWNGLLKLP